MDFARGNGIPMSHELGEPWSQAVRDWKAGREERGLPVPDKPPRRRVADYSRDVGAALPGEHWRHGKRRDDPGALVAWVRRYLEDLGPGNRSTSAAARGPVGHAAPRGAASVRPHQARRLGAQPPRCPRADRGRGTGEWAPAAPVEAS